MKFERVSGLLYIGYYQYLKIKRSKVKQASEQVISSIAYSTVHLYNVSSNFCSQLVIPYATSTQSSIAWHDVRNGEISQFFHSWCHSEQNSTMWMWQCSLPVAYQREVALLEVSRILNSYFSWPCIAGSDVVGSDFGFSLDQSHSLSIQHPYFPCFHLLLPCATRFWRPSADIFILLQLFFTFQYCTICVPLNYPKSEISSLSHLIQLIKLTRLHGQLEYICKGMRRNRHEKMLLFLTFIPLHLCSQKMLTRRSCKNYVIN